MRRWCAAPARGSSPSTAARAATAAPARWPATSSTRGAARRPSRARAPSRRCEVRARRARTRCQALRPPPRARAGLNVQAEQRQSVLDILQRAHAADETDAALAEEREDEAEEEEEEEEGEPAAGLSAETLRRLQESEEPRLEQLSESERRLFLRAACSGQLRCVFAQPSPHTPSVLTPPGRAQPPAGRLDALVALPGRLPSPPPLRRHRAGASPRQRLRPSSRQLLRPRLSCRASSQTPSPPTASCSASTSGTGRATRLPKPPPCSSSSRPRSRRLRRGGSAAEACPAARAEGCKA